MPIDFANPAHTSHDGTLIPISNQDLYDAGLRVLHQIHVFFRVPWSDETEQEYEGHVRQGWTLRQIAQEAFDRYDLRMANLPGGANPPTPFPPTGETRGADRPHRPGAAQRA